MSRPVLLLAALLSLISPLCAAQNYRILLSNDDGIESPLLSALWQALQSLPDTEVVVAAPLENQSGSSHSTAGTVIQVDRVERDGGFVGYAVHGRPADAVRFGIVELGREQAFDLVVSGINRGANVGDVAHLSGTIGAAMEGIYQGVPALAVSQDSSGDNTSISAQLTAQVVARYQSRGAPPGVLLSLNIPGGDVRGVVVRPMGDSYLATRRYELLDSRGDSATWRGQREVVEVSEEGTDSWAYQQGYATLTPLKFDWTAYDYLDEVGSWNIRLPD